MEMKAPYLQAIQAIAGKTPGEKQKTINSIARRIALAERSGGRSVDSGTQISDVPELLKPVVRLEVAKILRQYDVIIEALKSEDMNIVNRALHAKWFFDGSDTSVVNARYFLENVFPEISLHSRSRIVKNFATYLRNTVVAADFFLTLTKQYGVSQAIPLLVACDEDFAFKMIIENKIILSLTMVELLYRKYPNLVIKYLMLSKPVDEDVRNICQINIREYEVFLLEVARTRFKDFMDIFRMHDGLDVKLGKKATNTFLKTELDLLVEQPKKYIKLVSLETVTQKMRADDFAKMFKNLFPAKQDDFSFSTLNSYLQYYEPKCEKIPLILNTFREVYGGDLISFKHLVDSDLMKVLPEEDRVKQARIKLVDDKDWHKCDYENSWRCYLPTCESIPAITKEISESSDANVRSDFLRQLIYTCQVNNDKNALLKVLNYIYERHRNERKDMFYGWMSIIGDSFELATLGSAHWEISDKYIKFVEMKGDLCNQANTVSQWIGAGLRYCFLNGLPLDDYLHIFLDTKIEMCYDNWDILKGYPDLERKFLDLCIKVMPERYPTDHKIWKDEGGNIIVNLSMSLWDFNERNKVSNVKLEKLFVKDYPWLFEQVKDYILGDVDEDTYSKELFLRVIRNNDRDLYHVLIRDLEKFWIFDPSVIFDVLKKEPERVLDNWKECLEKARSINPLKQHLSPLITKSRWYQQLPIKFFEDSLKTYNDPESRISSMATLALLTDGETYTKIIEPYIPSDDKMDVNDPDAKDKYAMILAVATNFQKVNPPVSLEVIARFCVGDYLQMALRSLTSVCRRVPVAKVIPFAVTLTNRRVSVMKHGIRLIYLVAPLEEIYTHLTDLWNSKGHTSIRHVIFNKIYDLFCKQPNSRNWHMIRTCLDNLDTNDDEKIFKSLTELSTVPNEYLYEYIKSVLNAMKVLKEKSDDPKLYIDITCLLIKNIDWLVIKMLPEEYCQELIKEYLFVFEYNSDIFTAGMNLTLYSYLLSSKKYNESKFKFFGDFFRDSVEKYWNKSHPKCFKFYPLNFMTSKFFASICSITERHDVKILEAFLEIFQSAFQPHQDAVSYLDLVYSIAYSKSQTSVEFAKIIAEKIPELIQVFSPECVVPISNRLSSFLSHHTFCETENSEEMIMSIIEVFVNSGTGHCALFAANMLFNNTSTKLNERLKTVVHALRNFHDPGVSWFLNERLATFDFCTDSNG